MEKMIELIEKYFEKIDEEMSHGDYKAPEAYIPSDYDEEGEDYWDNHQQIIEEVIDLRNKIEKEIKKYKGEEE